MIGIVYIGNINRAPFLKKYTNILDDEKIKYDIIHWNRSSKENLKIDKKNYKSLINIYEYKVRLNELSSFVKKACYFKLFSKYTKKIIKKNNYKKLIILTTMTGIVLDGFLKRNYNKNYIFDYRDASYEHNNYFYKRLNKIIKHSYVTCISSIGFKDILPKENNYVMSHNINIPHCYYESLKQTKNYNFSYPINVSFIGGIRNYNYMKELIDLFKNDERFIFSIHGDGDRLIKIEKYTENIKNIICTGGYLEKEKGELIKKADIICYNYPESYNNNIALANKYYDSLIYQIPLLGNKKTYSGKLIVKKGLGISLDFNNKNYKEKIINYLTSFSIDDFNIKRREVLKEIKKDEKTFINNVVRFLYS